MGTPMNRARALPFGHAGAATPLLGLIAGPHADLVARFWPAPHTGFYALPTARRHAAGILLHRRFAVGGCDQLDIVHAVERARDGDLARMLGGISVPGGLIKALGRCGETLWDAGHYALFLRIFTSEGGAKVLRHMPSIEASRLALIGRLPGLLQVPGVISHLPAAVEAVEDLAEAFDLARRIHGDTALQDIAARWSRAGSALKLFDMAAEALQPVQFGGLRAMPALPVCFVPVTDAKTLSAVALEFRNCLRDFAGDLACGRMAVYVLRDGGVPIAVALRLDPAGWRLAEARGPNNDDVDEARLRRIVSAIEAAGGRTGSSSWSLATRLHEHVCSNCGPPHMGPRDTWRQRLNLGSLWD